MSRLLGLYPERWRARYGDEFLALLGDRPPAFRDRFDIVRGALDAHLSPQIQGPRRVSDRAGIGALVGFVLFYVAIAVALNGPARVDEYGTYRDGAAALPIFVLAMVFLAVAIGRTIGRLPAGQDRARVAGVIGLGCGILWSLAPWLVPSLVIFLVGALAVTVAAHHAGLWSRLMPILVAGLIVLPATLGVIQLFLPWYALREAGFNFLIVFVPISGLWLAYGIGLLRGFPGVAESPGMS